MTVNDTVREYGTDYVLPRAYMYITVVEYRSAMPVPVQFTDTLGVTYTIQPGQSISLPRNDRRDIVVGSLVSLDPNYVCIYKNRNNMWRDYYVDRVTGSHQETRYRDVQVPKTRITWNIRWKKISA